MAEASILVDQDQFICAVCLDLLKDPVAIPCGHSFCKVCINSCWNQEDMKSIYSCPQCRETFTPRPVLHRNNMLAELVEKLKKTELQADSPAHCYAEPGDVDCDSCIGRKRKSIKSCLVCLASYCEDHLKPHYQSQAFKKHKLVEACVDLQKKICSQHDKPIEIFCRTDQSFICYLCMTDEHKGHDTVSTTAERSKKQKRSQAAVDDNEKIFNEMISSLVKRRSEVTEMIRVQEKADLSRAEQHLKHLEQEITDLQRRVSDLEQLSHTPDHIHFLQSFPSLCVSPGCDDSPSFTVNQHLSFDGVRKSVSDLKKRVEEICQEEFNKIRPQDFCYLTLDPNTASPQLILSEKNRVVTRSDTEQRYSDHPERFDYWSQVLCKESVCGRCYWEVEWSGNVFISVSYKEISRKGHGFECVFGYNSKSWSLVCSSSSVYFWHNNIKTALRGPASSRIGVYVDHSAGTLSFYSVSEDTTNELKEEQIKSQQKIQEKQKKSFPSLCVSPECDDSPSFTVNQHLSFDGVRKSVSDLKKRVEEICQEEFNKIRPQDFCYLTLDPNTAHPQLILSEKNRVVTRSYTEQRYSDHPERFDSWSQVDGSKTQKERPRRPQASPDTCTLLDPTVDKTIPVKTNSQKPNGSSRIPLLNSCKPRLFTRHTGRKRREGEKERRREGGSKRR
ncbi:finTRIM family, member 14 [Silurus asotus]|uniref:FinTRIM family, member 14 n=1 Tax=Silurus asotus TaxID=30991 RepID=A0AAD5AE87_SILAS|nr:finTRIM family, member 14 [Silurus asotus]